MQKIKDADLPRFVDRWTIQYVRVFPHPIDRVWRALTDPKEFRAWFIVGSIELKTGGAYTFGEPEVDFAGHVLAIEAPRLIRFGGGPGTSKEQEEGWFQFELSEVASETRMLFTQHFAPNAAYQESPEEYLGGDLPVRSAPWKPGIVAGWHDIFDAMHDHLAEIPAGSLLPPSEFGALATYWASEQRRAGEFTAEQAKRYARQLRVYENYSEMSNFYRAFIRGNCPSN
jgi:uncharacterized protein YndB with AHSA1/START domain